MPKTTINYWNPLSAENNVKWIPIDGLEGLAEELTLSSQPLKTNIQLIYKEKYQKTGDQNDQKC